MGMKIKFPVRTPWWFPFLMAVLSLATAFWAGGGGAGLFFAGMTCGFALIGIAKTVRHFEEEGPR